MHPKVNVFCPDIHTQDPVSKVNFHSQCHEYQLPPQHINPSLVHSQRSYHTSHQYQYAQQVDKEMDAYNSGADRKKRNRKNPG